MMGLTEALEELKIEKAEHAQHVRDKNPRISGLESAIAHYGEESTRLEARIIELEKASVDEQAELDVATARNLVLNNINQEKQACLEELEALLVEEGDKADTAVAELSADNTALSEKLQKSEQSDGEKTDLLATLLKSDAEKMDQTATIQNEFLVLSNQLSASKQEAKEKRSAYERMQHEKEQADKAMDRTTEQFDELSHELTAAQEKYDIAARNSSEMTRELQRVKQGHAAAIDNFRQTTGAKITQLKRDRQQVQYSMDSLAAKYKKLKQSSEDTNEDRDRLRKEADKLTSDLQGKKVEIDGWGGPP